MPVSLVSSRYSHDEECTSANDGEGRLSREPIRIGLVNNMPGAAFNATENQFRFLLDSASKDISIELSLYVLRDTSKATTIRPRTASDYAVVDELWGKKLDGLIVTGAEPTTAALRDEPYWRSFTQLVEWARDNTLSTVWSCLAAHAAVLHLDGIERRRNAVKHFGIFPCDQLSDHWLLKGADSHIRIPHSRWNGVAEQDLRDHDYEVLTRTPTAQVDTFIKQENSHFVFYQGHPEYDTDTLLREYRRDVGRYLTNDADDYPPLPQGYFDSSTEKAFSSLQNRASSLHRDQLLDELATITKTIKTRNSWQSSAVLMYSNWLNYCRACKKETHPAETHDVPRIACQ